MKRLILSRKGFDSTAGGKASPILIDGSICSIPIPAHNEKFHGPSQHKYRDLKYDHVNMEDVFTIYVSNSNETFSMSKNDFYKTFDNVVNSKSYKRGNYNYSKIPSKAYEFLVKS